MNAGRVHCADTWHVHKHQWYQVWVSDCNARCGGFQRSLCRLAATLSGTCCVSRYLRHATFKVRPLHIMLAGQEEAFCGHIPQACSLRSLALHERQVALCFQEMRAGGEVVVKGLGENANTISTRTHLVAWKWWHLFSMS